MKGDTAGQGVVPLRTILRNILNLIDTFETRYKEGLDSYDQEFQELKQFSENLKSDPNYVCKEGEKSVNRKKNRYKDILPFDYTRVIIGDYGDIPGSDYINANFIKGASGSSAYIACQGPLPHTVNDFWRMVVECEVQVIVMACNEQESGKHKCENYWVEEEGVEREFGHVTVWLKKSRQVCPDFLVRTMKIRYPNSKGESEERSVCQFHYSAWPDHGVPLKVRPLLDMVRLIRDCQTSETLPVLVHCSAGCGRTGTICAIDYVWGLLRLGKLTPDFSLFNLVREMRRQRIAMVQTKDQYILVHRAVRELFEEQLKIIDSHPYANVDINGLPIEIKADLEEPLYETVQFVTATKREGEDENGRLRLLSSKPPPPPIPTMLSDSLSTVAASKHEKEAENHQRHLEQEKLRASSSTSSGSGNVKKVTCTPSPSTDSQSEIVVVENKDALEQEKEIPNERLSPKRGSFSSKQGGTSKSTLFRNPSIVKLKAFFEKSKEEKKSIPTLSRAKSDVSSSSRFYTNFTSSFTSKGSRNSPSRVKNTGATFASGSKPSSPKEEFREKSSPEKIKSKPALLAKPNILVKRSKSLKVARSTEDTVDRVNAIANTHTGSDIPDCAKLVRSSISSQSSSSSQSHLESHAIKVCVKQVEMPKLQKPISKSVKPEALKATTLDTRRNSSELKHQAVGYRGEYEIDSCQVLQPKKPAVPSKPQVLEKSSQAPKGTTRIKIGFSDDMQTTEKGNHSKLNGKINKYGTVNPKTLNSVTAGTVLTRSQSHVWQPSKVQVPVRIFSDENLSQLGTSESYEKSKHLNDRNTTSKGFDEPDNVKLIRKPSLPITKAYSSTAKSVPVAAYGSSETKEQPRSLTLTSHSTFLEARRRVPKTNPYANYVPTSENQIYKEKTQLPLTRKISPDTVGSSLTQFHFGESVPLLKNSSGNAHVGNSSESSSNPGTPRNSLPGTPTQSIDVLYSSMSGNPFSARGQSKSILKGSLSSTPSESDERLDSYKTHLSSVQSPVPTNITGPQKISSVRIAVGVGVRERRNSFRQAVWKEDQAPSTTSISVENEKPENIYITTTTSVPYVVKCASMALQHVPTSNNSAYVMPPTSAVNVRPHRDYEPIWPDSANSTKPFKIGMSTNVNTVFVNADTQHRKSPPRIPQHGFGSNINPFTGKDAKGQNAQDDSLVQGRMAEIKVLLEELRAPGNYDGNTQRKDKDLEAMMHSKRKSNEKLSQSFSGDKHSTSSSATNLKHHRSLRAPSRPQYHQGLSCFTFRKPSSFESITDQLYAEDLRIPATHIMDVSSGPTQLSSEAVTKSNDFFDESFHPRERTPANGQRLNDYVSLKTCRSSSVTRTTADNIKPVESVTASHIPPVVSKSDTTPIPPPRSKRSGTVRRDQSDYVNVASNLFHPSNHAWTGKEEIRKIDNQYYKNSVKPASSNSVRNESFPFTDHCDNHDRTRQNFPRTPNTEMAVPASNGNANPSSPKAIIRALGLFQAKAANVRSRFALWTENKDRSISKNTTYRSDSSRRNERSNEGGSFNEGPSLRTTQSSVSTAGPSTSKHQYL